MTFFQQTRSGHHTHQYFIDSGTNDEVCAGCGKVKGTVGRPSKFGNVASEYNGHIYHSKFEANYAAELDWRVKAKEIVSWERQVKLDLQVNDYHIANYYIDFVALFPDGHREFVETKGFSTSEFLLKWRIFETTFENFKTHPDDVMLLVKQSRSKKLTR